MSTSADCLISFGSNQGKGDELLAQVVGQLRNSPGIGDVSASTSHETLPIGSESKDPQRPYCNAAIRLTTDRKPVELLHCLLTIETGLGRVRRRRWGPRTVDLDLLLYGDLCQRQPLADGTRLTLPHPRMSFRRFVLVPSAEIAPEMVHAPSGLSIGELLECLDTTENHIAVHGNRDWLESLLAGLPREWLRRDEETCVAVDCRLESVGGPPLVQTRYQVHAIERLGQWEGLGWRPKLLVFRPENAAGAAPIFAGPQLALEGGAEAENALDFAAALAAMAPGTVR